MFGVNCSSSLLNAALQYHLGSEGLARGAFRVRKWLSNSKGLNRIEQIIEGRARKRDVLDHETYAKVSMQVSNNSDKSEKILGMSWNCESDKFIFSLEKLAQKAKSVVATRRNIRSMIAGFFSLRSRRYSRAQEGKLEIPSAQKLSILSSPAAG